MSRPTALPQGQDTNVYGWRSCGRHHLCRARPTPSMTRPPRVRTAARSGATLTHHTLVRLKYATNRVQSLALKYEQMKSETRTQEQIREHYEIEKELANKLRHASKPERRRLYSSLYDELFRRVPLHPQLTRRASPTETRQAVETQMRFLRPFLTDNSTFMEVGPGDCELSYEVSRLVRQVYAVEVSDEISKSLTTPDNFRLLLSDGCNIPLPRNSVNVAYSNHLMEHLHPEDALEQLRSIYAALVPSGFYICITPNRLSGPHDVSRWFDEIATGFHLREYTNSDMCILFREAGFSGVTVYVGGRGVYRAFPATALTLCESWLNKVPSALGRSIARSLPFGAFLSTVRIVGTK